MNKKEITKTLSSVWSLQKRTEKLLAEAKKWEVKPNINEKVKKIDRPSRVLGQLETIIRMSLKPELNKKEKKQLIRFTKRRLTTLKKHFSSIHNLAKKNPNILLDKKIITTEKILEERLSIYEKVIPLLFQKKAFEELLKKYKKRKI
jgi:hypothetical protein